MMNREEREAYNKAFIDGWEAAWSEAKREIARTRQQFYGNAQRCPQCGKLLRYTVVGNRPRHPYCPEHGRVER
jgi:formamidopyrimidine-DNA glycosylase